MWRVSSPRNSTRPRRAGVEHRRSSCGSRSGLHAAARRSAADGSPSDDPASVPAGKYAKAALEHLDAWDDVKDRLAPGENVRAALQFVARGECPLGIVYRRVTPLSNPQCASIGTFPADLHPPIVYPAATDDAGSRDPRPARVLAWLQDDRAATAVLGAVRLRRRRPARLEVTADDAAIVRLSLLGRVVGDASCSLPLRGRPSPCAARPADGSGASRSLNGDRAPAAGPAASRDRLRAACACSEARARPARCIEHWLGIVLRVPLDGRSPRCSRDGVPARW